MAIKKAISPKKLAFYYSKGFNVILEGLHGVGKSTIIMEAFKEAGLKENEWLYFSGATLDPWVDFVGVPKEKLDPETGEMYLDLVRPKALHNGDVKIIFIDEYNRSAKKIRNAVMELIQFKSINGKKYPNLKCVWAAVNPETDDGAYDVERTDPAQKDRFEIQIELPYEPSREYFVNKYGEEVGLAAVNWWNGLPPDVKKLVSPRRLDYALNVHREDGDIRDVLPESSNIKKLQDQLKSAPTIVIIKNIFDTQDAERAKEWLADENNYESAIPEILKNVIYIPFFIPNLPDEKISLQILGDKAVRNFALENYQKHENIKDILEDIVKAGTNQSLAKEIQRKFDKDKKKGISSLEENKNKKPSYYSLDQNGDPVLENPTWISKIKEIDLEDKAVIDRKAIIEDIESNMPKNMTETEANTTLTYLDKLIKRSDRKTLEKFSSSFVRVINNPIENLVERAGVDKEQIFDKYSNIKEYGKMCNISDGFYFKFK